MVQSCAGKGQMRAHRIENKVRIFFPLYPNFVITPCLALPEVYNRELPFALYTFIAGRCRLYLVLLFHFLYFLSGGFLNFIHNS